MPIVTLSDAKLRSLPVPQKGQQSYWDASFKAGSFCCRVSRGGTKTFLIKHKGRRITIGQFPVLSLADARTEARKLLAEFTLGKIRPNTIPYRKAVELFIEEKQKARRASTAAAYQGLLNRIGLSGPVADITHEEVGRRLKRIPTEGAYNHHLVALKVFFNWCIKRRYRDDNPTLGLSKHARPQKKRVLSDEELKAVWNAAEQMGGHFGTIVKLLILTGQRRNEIAALRKEYCDLGKAFCEASGVEVAPDRLIECRAQCTIKFPAEITKNHREHLFPIGSMASFIIAPYLAHESSFLLAARGSETRPFNGWSKSKKALDKLVSKILAKNDLSNPICQFTLHDLRRSYASRMAALGCPVHLIERLLNHAGGQISGVAAVYNQYDYLAECRQWQEQYEQHLTALLQTKSA